MYISLDTEVFREMLDEFRQTAISEKAALTVDRIDIWSDALACAVKRHMDGDPTAAIVLEDGDTLH